MSSRQFLTDEQWAVLAPLIPPPKRRIDGRGRPIEHDDRAVMDGVLWILRTGAAWADLPDRYPSYATCFRRFSRWVKDGTLRRLLEALAQDLETRGDIDLSECFIDGTFVVAKKGGLKWERPSAAKVRSSWPLRTLQVFHSPCTRLLLAHMKSPLSNLSSMRPSPLDCPSDLSGIVPTTVIRSMTSSQPTVLN
jgi:transposase